MTDFALRQRSAPCASICLVVHWAPMKCPRLCAFRCLQERSVPIPSLPGQRRLSPSDVLKEIDEARRYGVNAFMFFPKIDDSLKSPLGKAVSYSRHASHVGTGWRSPVRPVSFYSFGHWAIGRNPPVCLRSPEHCNLMLCRCLLVAVARPVQRRKATTLMELCPGSSWQ